MGNGEREPAEISFGNQKRWLVGWYLDAALELINWPIISRKTFDCLHEKEMCNTADHNYVEVDDKPLIDVTLTFELMTLKT